MPSKNFARIVVEPVNSPVYAGLGNIVKVCAFRELPPYHLVLLLVASAFVTAVRVTVVDMRPGFPVRPPGPLHAPAIRKLRAVVNGNAFEYVYENGSFIARGGK